MSIIFLIFSVKVVIFIDVGSVSGITTIRVVTIGISVVNWVGAPHFYL